MEPQVGIGRLLAKLAHSLVTGTLRMHRHRQPFGMVVQSWMEDM